MQIIKRIGNIREPCSNPTQMSYRGPSILSTTRQACLLVRKEATQARILPRSFSSFRSSKSLFLLIQLKAPFISSMSAPTTFFSFQALSTIDTSITRVSIVLLPLLYPNYLLYRILLSLHQEDSQVAIIFSITFPRQFRRLITL